jgi:anaerobic dimethyl sulfoxide reductase subunit C (anchor subunit)
MHEWPLLIFTLLVQGAVGVTLFLTLLICGGNTSAGKREFTTARLVPTLFMLCVLGGVGLLASVFHLGYPLNAFNALRHFSQSWLSREIVFASLFLACVGLGMLSALAKWPLWRGLIPLALLVGLIDVYCMSEIYMHTSVVTWMHANTLVMFYGSVGVVGAVLACWLLPNGVLKTTSLPVWAAALVVIVVLVRLLIQPSYITWLADAGLNDAITFPHQPLEAFRALSGLRMFASVLSVVGVLIFAAGGVRRRKGLLLTGGAVLLVAEVLLRYVFFSIN